MIKDEFGPEAVILSVRDLKKNGGLLGFIKNPGVEVTAAVEAESLKRKFAEDDRAIDSGTDGKPDDMDAGKSGTLYKQMMQIVKYQRNSPSPPVKTPASVTPASVRPLRKQMISQCVSDDIVRDVVKEVGNPDNGNIRDQVAGLIEKMGVSACPPALCEGDRKTWAFIGPTGSGKTTTIAKLAAVYAVRMKKRVAVVTIDNDRIGAIEQLGIYAKIIGIPMEVASDARELDKIIGKLKNRDLILIDTPGTSPYNEKKIAEMKKTFRKSKGIDFHLVASAATKDEDLGVIFEKFRALPIKSVVFTKIDETSIYGPMLNQLVRCRLPVSLLACGQEIPEDLEIATVNRLAGLVTDREGNTENRSGIAAQLSNATGPASKTPVLTHILGAYVGNKNSDIFHHPDCSRVKKIKPENIVLFESRADALGKKVKPCKVCCPDIAETIELSPGVTEERKFLLKK